MTEVKKAISDIIDGLKHCSTEEEVSEIFSDISTIDPVKAKSLIITMQSIPATADTKERGDTLECLLHN